MDPRDALLLFPSTELDMFVFKRCLEGPDDFGGFMPNFSKNFAHTQALLVKMLMTNGGELKISLSPYHFSKAIEAKQLVKKNECPIWKIEHSPYVGYGRNLAEAICKLVICETFQIRPESDSRPSTPA